MVKPDRVLIAIALVASVFGATPAAARDLTEDEKAKIEKVLRHGARDADSVKFRWMPLGVLQDTDPGFAGGIYCGMVNAKNGYGGYTGFEPYAVMLGFDQRDAGGDVLIYVEVIATSNGGLEQAIVETCLESGYDVREAVE